MYKYFLTVLFYMIRCGLHCMCYAPEPMDVDTTPPTINDKHLKVPERMFGLFVEVGTSVDLPYDPFVMSIYKDLPEGDCNARNDFLRKMDMEAYRKSQYCPTPYPPHIPCKETETDSI